ncbi:MAG: PilZ domain-containing protein [Thermoleophilia bacterium]
MSLLPEPNQHIAVFVHDWETELASRVEDSAPGHVHIAFPSDGLATFVVPNGQVVDLAWTTGRGPARVQGVVTGRVPGRVPLLTIELASDPVVQQRREHVRASAFLDLDIAPPELWKPVQGITLDVSGGGVRAHLPADLELDASTRLTLHVPDDAPIAMLARVVRRADDDSLGMQFELIAPPDRERLIRFVFARLRNAVHVGDLSRGQERR